MDTGPFMTAEEARERLGIGKQAMARLLKSGELPISESPLDKRLKLVKRDDVERLAALPHAKPRSSKNLPAAA